MAGSRLPCGSRNKTLVEHPGYLHNPCGHLPVLPAELFPKHHKPYGKSSEERSEDYRELSQVDGDFDTPRTECHVTWTGEPALVQFGPEDCDGCRTDMDVCGQFFPSCDLLVIFRSDPGQRTIFPIRSCCSGPSILITTRDVMIRMTAYLPVSLIPVNVLQ